jgi:hypothetical protein
MIRRCILHIGTYKTGTTSIQWTLKANQDNLATRGIALSDIAPPGHGPLQRYAMRPTRTNAARKVAGETSLDAILAWRARVEAELDALAATECETLVFSDEGLSAKMDADEIDRMHQLLKSRCTRVEVLVYLRPQHERKISDYSQHLRSGLTGTDILATKDDDSWNLCYEKILGAWATSFGEDAMRPRLYQRDQLLKGDAVADFMGVLGIDSAELKAVPLRNAGIRADAQLWLRELNAHMPRLVNDKRNPARSLLLDVLNAHFTGRGLLPTRTEAEAFFNRFRDVNEAVRARWFPDRSKLFDVSFDDYPESVDSGALRIDKAAEITAAILNVLAERRDMQRPKRTLRAVKGDERSGGIEIGTDTKDAATKNRRLQTPPDPNEKV